MFTGIIEATGTVESIQGHRISIRTPWDKNIISLGQSIAVQGCCLTVVDIEEKNLSFDLSDETLSKTIFSTCRLGQKLNLERGMSVGSRMDGHWVTGHVDTKALIQKIIPIPDQSSTTLVVSGLKSYAMNLIPKGSIAIDGVSLTINDVSEDTVSVCLIPYTMEHTVFSTLKENDLVHIEFDMIGKYFVKFFENYKRTQETNHAKKN